jgi:hypothetical protein
MDVFIVPEAQREIDTLLALWPRPGAWGVIIGHRRGPRFIVEKVAGAGNPGTMPDERILAELERIWPGRIIGIAVLRPNAAFKKAALGPAWYGKLILVASGSVKAPALRPYVVEFCRRFFLDAVPFAPPVKEEVHE